MGLIGSGMFVTDPVGGFPPRSLGGAGLDHAGSSAAPTLAGRLHNLFAIPIFAGIPVAAIASAATAVRSRDFRWAGYSAASGLAMVGSFVMFGIAFGDESRVAAKGGSSSGHRSHAGAAGSPPFRDAPSPLLPNNQERSTSCS